MNPKEFGRIGVFAGGPSNEREISLRSGQAVHNALRDLGADAVFLDVASEGLIKGQIKESGIDVAFIALHGRFGEDGAIQQIMEDLNIPYTGSGPWSSRLALDKIASKEVFIKHKIDVPKYKVVDKKTNDYMDAKVIAEIIKFPLIVKPQFEGSSIGITIVKDESGLVGALDFAFGFGDRVLVEEYIKGREITVGILDNEPLPVIEVIVGEQFYNFTAKYNSDDTQYITPAQIDPVNYKNAQDIARQAHSALGCRSFSRVDMILDERQKRLVVLEVNSIPGLTDHSLLPKAAAAIGIGFPQLCAKILESALSASSGGGHCVLSEKNGQKV